MNIKKSGFLTAFILTSITSFTTFYYLEYKNSLAPQEENKFLNQLDQISTRFNDYFYEDKIVDIHSSGAVLVGVDSASVTEVGRWPWSRDVVRKVSENILASGANSLAYDIIFGESENAAIDGRFGQFIEKNSTKVILGTTSEQPITVQPYQDFCLNEAFLYNGGGEIVKDNFQLVVDDVAADYDNLRPGELLKDIFEKIDAGTVEDFNLSKNVKSVNELTIYQKNTLNFNKKVEIYRYCTRWLTERDTALGQNKLSLTMGYDQLLSNIKKLEDLPAEDKISVFKKDILNNPIIQYGHWQPNIPELQTKAQLTASFIAKQDTDGLIRRYPLVYRTGNRLGTSFIPSMGLQTYLSQTGYQAFITLEVKDGYKQLTKFEIKDLSGETEKIIMELPVDKEGELLINYYGKANTLPVVSAKDLLSLSDKISVYTKEGSYEVDRKEFFKGKSVIMGATAVGINDIRNTPTDIIFLGPEIHLTVANNLLQQNFIRYHPNESKIALALLLILGFSLSWAFLSFEILNSFFIYFATNATFYFCLLQFRKSGYVVQSSFSVLVALFIIFFGIIVYQYFFEAKKSKEIKKTFSKYVSKEIVEELLKNEANLELKGQKLNMTVYFSDIRGFTEFSEKMDPQELSLLLNKYLTPMTQTIFSHKGTIDKFMGDGVMAMFGAPLNYKNHAEQACAAALACIENLEQINQEFAKRAWPKIKIGIGLNTGFMNAGNIGSDTIQSYTVIGDAVNLASRVESLTKNYGVKILITEATYADVKEIFPAREVDRVRVKGKTAPIKIYELISKKDSYSDKSYIDQFVLAYTSYQNKHFAQAKLLFEDCVKMNKGDAVCELYIERCTDYIAQSPPPDWDGVYDYKVK